MPVGAPWVIRMTQPKAVDAIALAQEETVETKLPACIVDKIGRYLNYNYPHAEATRTPSKQTATQLKGRQKDREAAENTRQNQHYRFRKPSFVAKTEDAATYGNLMHSIMERIDLSVCTEISSVNGEINRLVQEGYLDPTNESLVDVDAIWRFLNAELGRKIRDSKGVLREFKFSVLDDATRYGNDLAQEQVLLQGVVDLALIEDDGITIVDFKTDRVTAETIDEVAEKYRQQVKAYVYALERIFERPVKNAYLYFFRLGRFYPV